jgi:hypothetical protein
MRSLLVTIATVSALVYAQDAAAVTYTVHNERGLQATLRVAGPGDTIRLAKGTWAQMAISHRNFGAGKQVIITGSPGTISRGFEIVGSSGIKFVNLSFNGDARHTIIGGTYGNNITISTCAFTNADEFIHVHGGTTWVVERNSFGQNNAGLSAVKFEPGAKMPQFRNVLVQNNLFRAKGFGRIGVGIKAASRAHPDKLPYNVKIIHNTIITRKSGVALSDGWDRWERSLQPIIANNVMNVFAAPFNTRGRLFSNVAELGTVVPGVDIGPLNLSANLSPSASSTLVIDRADPLYAPDRDYYNNARVRAPDLGAIEYRGSPAPGLLPRRRGV